MTSIYNARGEMIHPDPSVLPPDVFALVEELHKVEHAYEVANDDVFQAERRIKAAKEEDAAELRDLLAAGKPAPKVIDKHEREALADHARARAIKTATHPQIDKAQQRLQSAVRSHLGEIEKAAADAAHSLGEKYRAALTEAARLREQYAARLDDWSDVRRERQRLSGDDSWSWKPESRSSVIGGAYEPSGLLAALVDEDAIRHVPKPRRFAGTQKRLDWEQAVQNGERLDPDSLEPYTTTGFESVDNSHPRHVERVAS